MKKLHLFKTVLLLCALIVGSVNGWATDTLVETIDFTGGDPKVSSYAASSTWGNWTVVGAANNGGNWAYMRIGGGKTNSSPSTITGTQALTDAVDYIEISHNGRSNKSFSVTSVVVESSSSTNFSSPTSTTTVSNPDISEAGTITITPSEQVATNSYYKITINWTGSTSKNYGLDTYTVKFYKKTPAGPVDLTSFDFTNSTPAVQLSKNGSKWEAEYTQAVVADPDDYDGTVTYSIVAGSSTIPAGWTVDVSSAGVVSIDATTNEAASIVVKASGTGTEKYNAPDDATYTLGVTAAPEGVGTPTFSKATGSYYYNTKVEIESVNASSIYYTTDGTTPSKSSTLYDDEEGVKITKSMTLKAIGYDGETASDVASIEYTLKAPEAPTFSVAAGAVAKGTVVTLTPGEGGSTVIYTTDGTTPSYSESNGEIGTEVTINYGQTIKAITVDDGENESTVASATYTLTIPTGTVYYELVTDASTLNDGDKILIVNSDVTCTMNTASDKNNRPQVEVTKESDGTIKTLPETAQIITLEADGDNWYFNVGTDAYLYASSKSSNQLKTAGYSTVGDNGKATITISSNIATILFQGTNSHNGVRYNSNNSLFSCYDPASDTYSNMGDVKIYVQKSEEPTEVVTVSSHGWATYIPSYAVQFPANRAYVVTDVDGDKTEVEAVTKVPARTPVLLKGEGEVTATILDEEVDAPATNLLSVGTGYAVDGKYSYVLAKNGENKAGFKQWTGAMSVLKDRVVLLLDDVLEARDFLFLDFEGETTGINAALMNNERMNNEVYNLNGQRVAQPTKGLYIVNGRKVVIK